MDRAPDYESVGWGFDSPPACFFMDDRDFMQMAIEEAKIALEENEVPVGAVVVCNGKVIGRGHNRVEKTKDVTAHAEILAIRDAEEKLAGWRLNECEIFSTCEPCPMCAGAIMNARLKRLVYGASQPKFGSISLGCNILANKALNHKIEIESGLLEKESSDLLKRFFSSRRDG